MNSLKMAGRFAFDESLPAANFRYMNLIQRFAMPLSELESYYCAQRKYLFKQGKEAHYFPFRKFLHPLLIKILAVDRHARKQTLTVLNQVSPESGATIYACTHIGGDDAARLFEAIQSHCFLFLGDPKGLYRDASGLMLYLNGCICTETADKTDRRIAYMRAVELLHKGESIMIFPEGAWNITENLPVMQLFTGTARMAQETNARILPIAIEQYGTRFVVNAGKPIFPLSFQSPEALTTHLRDALASLKWEIWEQEGVCHSASLTGYTSQSFADEIIHRCPYDFSVQDVERTRYHTRDTSPQEAFAHLKQLHVGTDTAFLLRSK